MMYLSSNVRLDLLVEEVTNTACLGSSHRVSSFSEAEAISKLEKPRTVDVDKFVEPQILLDVDPSLDWRFHVESGSFRRIVLNVLGNALKYTTRGCITVSLNQSDTVLDARKKTTVELKIEDSGRGMSDEYFRSGIYRPFTQEDAFSPGLGLGLSITHRIVDALRGTIDIQSQQNMGTVAVIRVPVERFVETIETSMSERGSVVSARSSLLFEVPTGLHMKRLSFFGFDPGEARSKPDVGNQFNTNHTIDLRPLQSSIEKICRSGFSMTIVAAVHEDETAEQPDFRIIPMSHLHTTVEEYEHLVSIKSYSRLVPNIVVCDSVISAKQLYDAISGSTLSSFFHIIAQP